MPMTNIELDTDDQKRIRAIEADVKGLMLSGALTKQRLELLEGKAELLNKKIFNIDETLRKITEVLERYKFESLIKMVLGALVLNAFLDVYILTRLVV